MAAPINAPGLSIHESTILLLQPSALSFQTIFQSSVSLIPFSPSSFTSCILLFSSVDSCWFVFSLTSGFVPSFLSCISFFMFHLPVSSGTTGPHPTHESNWWGIGMPSALWSNWNLFVMSWILTPTWTCCGRWILHAILGLMHMQAKEAWKRSTWNKTPNLKIYCSRWNERVESCLARTLPSIPTYSAVKEQFSSLAPCPLSFSSAKAAASFSLSMGPRKSPACLCRTWRVSKKAWRSVFCLGLATLHPSCDQAALSST